ncbi:hypothetical protein LWM68_40765 [Niabella sp. W65]|nr:hypothetical protein [Niabella sp. W65]MCH7368506.1 hypothetical protein [Niabella sp. W65]
MKKNFKIKNIKADVLEGLYKLINDTLGDVTPMDDYEALLIANLRNMQEKISVKLLPHKWQVKYTFDLPAEQALALRIFYTRYIDDDSTALNVNIMRIAHQIHQYYQ